MSFEAKTQLHEPYRYLFPAGVLAALTGLVLWLAFQWGWLNFYPRQAHANLMYFGFMWAFVTGFLMTAIPKMTVTPVANRIEIGTALVLIGLQVGLNLFNMFSVSISLVGLQALYILYFAGRRFLLRKNIPFEGFIFAPFAIFQIFVALFYFWFSDSLSMDRFYLLAGEAFILNLILGVGTRLIPTISRVPAAVSPHVQGDRSKIWKMGTIALVLNAGFWMHFSGFEKWGLATRLFVVLYMAIFYLRILAPMIVNTLVGWGLRVGVLFIILSYAVALFEPSQLIAVRHLLYVGGFVLITFMVGTRVMLAHGGQDLVYETNSKRIGVVALLIALASGVRFVAGSDIMGLVMTTGILLFLAAALIWLHKFVRILLKS